MSDQTTTDTAILVEDLSYWFAGSRPVLDKVSFRVEAGEYIGLVGHNGSGKSTLLRLITGLLDITSGRVRVEGLDPSVPGERIRLRQRLGLVFQNPDNQIVGTIVEDDVAFGPENLGLETSQIRQRVDQALDRVHLTSRRYQSPANLSGGQRQRLAIASLLALEPAHLLLDEALSMLDPRGREEVEALLDDLHVGHGITIVHATHNLEELARADRILALEAGRVVFDGPAGDFFEDRDLMDRLHLELSPAMEIAHPLLKRGLLGRPDRFDLEGLLEAITR